MSKKELVEAIYLVVPMMFFVFCFCRAHILYYSFSSQAVEKEKFGISKAFVGRFIDLVFMTVRRTLSKRSLSWHGLALSKRPLSRNDLPLEMTSLQTISLVTTTLSICLEASLFLSLSLETTSLKHLSTSVSKWSLKTTSLSPYPRALVLFWQFLLHMS